ncbi:glycosyltransferase 48 kDa subunit-like protein [Striga asiatica]|uniref:Dolichyl-diphosphooligosaccharide--protein glycosyltransferase 48 kDa subunit n=1 Tax=Striga asiatica TaxID=4170 RepID=A0A5A7R282_STRAF|nr:glycosyltransferase 48 kDa subunit-like protein [Striga asiatica]
MVGKLLSVLLISFLSCAVLCASFSEENPTDRRVLVLLDDLAIKSSHSIFFDSLRGRGYDLNFKLADDPKLALKRYGQYLYDAVIVFSPNVERFGGSVDAASLLEFVDSGRDMILAADKSASELIREIAVECGVDFDEDPASMVIDHTSYAVSESDGDHTLLASDDFIQSEVILGRKKIEAPVLFRGIGHSINPANNLVLKVLSASSAAYSANPKSMLSSAPTLTGSGISLVSIVQARNNARILISGSLSMFSNRFFRSGVQKAGTASKHEKSGNEQFLTELSKWVFHERGHLKAVNVKHHKAGLKDEPSMYRIKDDLEYSVEVYEWSGKSWEPYVADDLQGLYYTSFKVPDVYGVFQFKVEYQRLGYTSLSLAKQIPVRPFRHNEYERFITAAYPYYGASFSMSLADSESIRAFYFLAVKQFNCSNYGWVLCLHGGVSVHEVAENSPDTYD